MQPENDSYKSSNGKSRNNGMKHAKKKKHARHQKTVETVADLDTMIESSRATVVDDVKRLLQAKENGVPHEELVDEIKRLCRVIIDGCMQDAVIEGCGKHNLLSVLRWGRKATGGVGNKSKKKSKGKKKNRPAPPGEAKDRVKWLRWYRAMYGINGKNEISAELYYAIMVAASSVNFTEILSTAKTEMHFHQNGLAECYSVARKQDPNISYEPPKEERRKKYNPKPSYSQITKKEWGSLYKPARG